MARLIKWYSLAHFYWLTIWIANSVGSDQPAWSRLIRIYIVCKIKELSLYQHQNGWDTFKTEFVPRFSIRIQIVRRCRNNCQTWHGLFNMRLFLKISSWNVHLSILNYTPCFENELNIGEVVITAMIKVFKYYVTFDSWYDCHDATVLSPILRLFIKQAYTTYPVWLNVFC